MIVVLGLASGVLTTGAWLPQLRRTWRRGHADDISYGYLVAFGSGVAGWVAYGAASGQPAVLVTNGVTLALVVALAALKIRPRRPPPGPASGGSSGPGARTHRGVPTASGSVARR